MHGRFIMAAAVAAAAGVLAATGLSTQTALAAQPSVIRVPCSASALTAAVSGATSGKTLSLATWCTYGLSASLPAILQNLTIQGNHATIERSSAAGTPEFSLMAVGSNYSDQGGKVEISNLNFRGGAPAIDLLNGSLTVNGGAFSANTTAIESNFHTTLTVAGATFMGNTGTTLSAFFSKIGGAILASSKINLSDDSFTGNTARLGGAVYIQNGSGTITRCRFVNNTATAGGGGLYDDGDVTMADSTFTGNRAQTGGAVVVFDLASATLGVTGSAFVANSAQIGGAIYNYDGLTVTGSTFTANRATQGGAIDQDWYGTLTDDHFTRNTATAGGGAMFAGYNTLVDHTTFTRNTAGTDGGAIDSGPGSLDSGGPLTVSGSSITGNTAGTDGGGIFSDNVLGTTAAVTGTATAGNRPDNCAPAGAVPGCAALAPATGGDGGSAVPSRPVPKHHGGHLPQFLLREMTGR